MKRESKHFGVLWKAEEKQTGDSRGIFSIRLTDGWAEAKIQFDFEDKPPIVLRGQAAVGDEVIVNHYGYRIALYVNGKLWDEDWPVGNADIDDAGKAELLPEPLPLPEPPPAQITCPVGWKPEGFNTWVGDCMPFCHDGVFHLFYLFDRRGHKSKWGKGAHQWAHLSSRDLVTWEVHPIAIPITRQEEGSICTGSVLFLDGLYYAFYTIRPVGDSPAYISWSVSSDGIHFEKTDKTFALSNEYNQASARDPLVFADGQGEFHMLLTTTYRKSNTGCLAHLTSNNLQNWQEQEPFVVLDISNEPECSDYFYANGFYYLLYSNFGTARYFISKEPFGPWIAPKNNEVVGETLRVPKSCIWENGRIIFCGFQRGGDGYGGTLDFYEAKQKTDGTLVFGPVKELMK